MVVILAHICWINLHLNDICLERQSTRKMSHLLLDRTSFDLEMGLMYEDAKNCPRLCGGSKASVPVPLRSLLVCVYSCKDTSKTERYANYLTVTPESDV